MTKVLISYIMVQLCSTWSSSCENSEIIQKAKEGYEFQGGVACAQYQCFQPMVKYEYRE